MERDLLKYLIEWKDKIERKPLLVRGARQVGKTWLITHFGESHFEHFIEINFELQPNLKACFKNLNPTEIILNIELTLNTSIVAGKTLLFLDEIQECPEALKSLRYFFEKMPELHVISAGSLLEFILNGEDFSFPVGRIQNYYLYPLSFGEFLTASGEHQLRSYLQSLTLEKGLGPAIHHKCLDLFYLYLYTGGMPEAVSNWFQHSSFNQIGEIHQTLLQNYRHDFGKYGRRVKPNLIEKVYTIIPGMVGSKFKYSHVDNRINSRDIKESLNVLIKTNVAYQVFHSSCSGIPVRAYIKRNLFKILFLDVGLLQNSMGITRDIYLSKNVFGVYKGSVAEQFVGQQLLTLRKHYEEPELFYWHRESKGSEAEIDYLWQKGEQIFPIEVKAGKTGTLRSLKLFLKEKQASFGIRFSLNPLSFYDSVLSIPIYATESMEGLIDEALQIESDLMK